MSDESKYNKQTVTLRKIAGEGTRGPDAPGDFFWDVHPLGSSEARYLFLCLPGETHCSPIKVQRGSPGGERIWGWDGNEDCPTVTPSIHWVGHWHGFLNAGVLKSC